MEQARWFRRVTKWGFPPYLTALGTLKKRRIRDWAGTARHSPAFGNACTCQNPIPSSRKSQNPGIHRRAHGTGFSKADFIHSSLPFRDHSTESSFQRSGGIYIQSYGGGQDFCQKIFVLPVSRLRVPPPSVFLGNARRIVNGAPEVQQPLTFSAVSGNGAKCTL